MSTRDIKDRNLKEIQEEKGDVINNRHLFIVKNKEKHATKQYWVPVPGTEITAFLTGQHEWMYVGPQNSPRVREYLADMNEKQAEFVGKSREEDLLNFEVSLDLPEFEQKPRVPDALDTPLDELIPDRGGKRKTA